MSIRSVRAWLLLALITCFAQACGSAAEPQRAAATVSPSHLIAHNAVIQWGVEVGDEPSEVGFWDAHGTDAHAHEL